MATPLLEHRLERPADLVVQGRVDLDIAVVAASASRGGFFTLHDEVPLGEVQIRG
jgi:hypothetical protein